MTESDQRKPPIAIAKREQAPPHFLPGILHPLNFGRNPCLPIVSWAISFSTLPWCPWISSARLYARVTKSFGLNSIFISGPETVTRSPAIYLTTSVMDSPSQSAEIGLEPQGSCEADSSFSLPVFEALSNDGAPDQQLDPSASSSAMLSLAPHLLDLILRQCNGPSKRALRRTCSSLRQAVEARVTSLTWETDKSREYVCNLARRSTSLDQFFGPDDTLYFNESKGKQYMAIFSRCPELLKIDFNVTHHGNCVSDLSFLSQCTGLRELSARLRPTDLAPFAAFSNLERLNCSNSFWLSNISALAACTALTSLDCSCTSLVKVPDWLPPNLQHLKLSGPNPRWSPVSPLAAARMNLLDISALVHCTTLKSLDCANTGVKWLPPLPGLEHLNISRTQCDNVSQLEGYASLVSLDISQAPIGELEPLAACKKLRRLHCCCVHEVHSQLRQIRREVEGPLEVTITQWERYWHA